MGLFSFLMPKTSGQLASELVAAALSINLNESEKQLLVANNIALDQYQRERLMLQLEFIQGFISFLAFDRGIKFFQDVGNHLEIKVSAAIESHNNFGLTDLYAAKTYMEKYYSFNTPEHLLTQLFHALRDESLIRKNDHTREVFLNGLKFYAGSIGHIVKPHLKAS